MYGIFEVTIGFNADKGKISRVDYMTMNSKSEFKCYEIKISKSDFHSKAHNTFVGHWNYYVLTKELYEQVKSEIPSHLGVYVDKICVKKAKRQELIISVDVLKDSMIRSLCREFQKQYKSEDDCLVAKLNRSVSKYKSERNKYKKLYEGLNNKK